MFNKKETLKVFPLKMHFKKESMTKINSFSDISNIDGIRVIFHPHLGVHLDVILPSGQTYRFKQINERFFHFDIAVDSPFMYNVFNLDNNKSKNIVTEYLSLQTVSDNKSSYTVNDI